MAMTDEQKAKILSQKPSAYQCKAAGAQEIWRDMLPVVIEVRDIWFGELFAFAELCNLMHRANKLYDEIESRGDVVPSVRGPKPNQANASYYRCTDQINKLLKEFGLSPSSGRKFSGTDDDESDGFDEFING